jgi:predicted nucleotide-binding protein
MLRRWQVEPLLLDQLPSGGQTIIEKLESVRRDANFAVVLATPDDEGYARGKPDEKAFRVRQNVVLELGMMLVHLGRSRVAILMKSDVNMERPSDIQGLLYIPYKAYPSTSGDAIRSGDAGKIGVEQITNIRCSRGRHDRRSGLPDRIPATFRG